MAAFCIIETDDGLAVVEHSDETTAEQAVHRRGGVVIDPGPFDSYEEAYDALGTLQAELENETRSDVPGT